MYVGWHTYKECQKRVLLQLKKHANVVSGVFIRDEDFQPGCKMSSGDKRLMVFKLTAAIQKVIWCMFISVL